MNVSRLPEDKQRKIDELTRAELGITEADAKRAACIGTVSLALAVVTSGTAAAYIGYRWGVPFAFFFLLSLAWPCAKSIHIVLGKGVLARIFIPKWLSDYQGRADTRSDRGREVMQTATFWESLDGHAFEREFARLLRGHGFVAEVTPGSGDGGVDIVARDRFGAVAIQCKRYRKPVGPAVVRELFGAVTAGKYSRGIPCRHGRRPKGSP